MTPSSSARWLRSTEARLEDLQAVLASRTDPAGCPRAADLVREVPIYDSAALRRHLAEAPTQREALMAEWAWVWEDGPGILVIRGAFGPAEVLDPVTACFESLIRQERAAGPGSDHFAAAGANDRVWNALEKLCLMDPEAFARYYASDMLDLAAEAWLGPGWQLTSQINNVRPGGAAQMPHRDYHLGFMTTAQAERYPAHVHRLSPMLTLQGAVAHVDMPIESGPTLYLPHSQKFAHGYLVAGRTDVQACFEAHQVQLPLARGDAVFFNPALLHAAGANRSTDIQRLANLLQISSPFGRAMETIDRQRMTQALHPVLRRLREQGWSEAALARVIAASAEGYAFPTNLDRDPPRAGLAPDSVQQVVRRALAEDWAEDRLAQQLDTMAARRLS